MWSPWNRYADKRLEERTKENCPWVVWDQRLKEFTPVVPARYRVIDRRLNIMQQLYHNKISGLEQWRDVP